MITKSPKDSLYFLALLFSFLCMVGTAWAGDVSASAAFSQSATTVFEPVELQVIINGSTDVSAPEVRVDGLDIQQMGPPSSVTQFSLINGAATMSRKLTYNYAVTPKRAGTFTVPALRIAVGGGKTVSTQPVSLNVVNGGQPPPSSQSAPSSQSTQNPPTPPRAQPVPQDTPENRQYFAEWVVPVSQAYVGQSIPVEYRLYVDSGVSWSPDNSPEFATGDGFTTTAKFAKQTGLTVNRGGRNYDLVVFKTAITPVKTGKLTLPPTVVVFNAQVRQRLPSVFGDFGQQITTRQNVGTRSEAQDFEVIPLPTAGRPKTFTGAVGQFTLTTKANPIKVHAGDPITVTAEISGIGNFDQPAGPVIADEAGWKAYPPSSKFTPDDDIGLSGVKTFEAALIPSGHQQSVPKIEFSYFDPSRKQYVTLTGDRIAVAVEGSAAPSPTPLVASGSIAAAGTASATPQPRPNDIFFIRYDSGRWGVAFEPVWRSRTFWMAQLFPLGALLGFCGWQWRQARLGDLRARRLAALRTEKAESARLLRLESTRPGAFYQAAVRVLQLETAIRALDRRTDRDPATLDAEAVCAGRSLDADTAADVRKLFAAHDELHYAGAGGQDGAVPPERREQVLRILERFETSHA